MTGPAPLRSYLASRVASAPLSAEEMDTLRARAWAEQGVVVLHPAEIGDDWLRARLVNEATTRWGRRFRK